MKIHYWGRVDYQEVDSEKSSLSAFLDDDKKDDKPEVKEEVKPEEEEEKPEEKEEVKKEKEEKEDDIVLARVDYDEIKKEFPELFKKYPTLKHAFFREQQFTEIYPTVEDAKAASEAQQQLEEITEVVTSGNVEEFFTSLKNESEDGYKKFTAHFIPTLRTADRDTYLEVVSPEISRFLKNVFEHGKKEKDENIQNAAKIVRKVIFGGAYDDIDKEVEEPLINTKKTPREEQLEKDLAKEANDKYQKLYGSVTDSCYSALDTEINKGLTDLKGREGVQKLIAKEVKQQILDEMNKDGGYISRMNALWKKEQRNGFSGTSKDSLQATFLAKAKAILPKIRAKVRKDTLGTAEPVKEEPKEPGRPEVGKHSSGNTSSSKIKEAAKTSTKAIFDA